MDIQKYKQMEAEQKALEDQENPLLFWAAYMLDKDGKTKRYLGNGKGGYRLFKTLEGPDGLNAYLDKFVHPARRPEVHVHSVQGTINVPVEDQDIQDLTRRPELPRQPNILERLPINIPQLPMSTLSRESQPPSAVEVLHELEEKHKKRRRRK